MEEGELLLVVATKAAASAVEGAKELNGGRGAIRLGKRP